MSITPNFSGLEWSNVIYDIPKPKQKGFGSKKAQSAPDTEKNADVDASASAQNLASVPEGYRRLLRGVSGRVNHGEYLGILGSSGAGKTTLLNILSARVGKLGKISGTIKYNGQKRDPSTWKRTVGYVEQDDAMLPRSTVRETIEYASKLRLPNSEFTKADKRKRAVDTMRMLRLDDCADTRVGSAVERGVSGGERKRASIAIELVSDVALLFLDEPTSGLDAYAAESLISNMSQVVKERSLACCMTIHQPSWSIFTKLDRVLLLARGGVYYDGPPRETIPWFESLGYTVPEGMNPADYFISITENAQESDDRSKTVESLIASWNGRKRGTAEFSNESDQSLSPASEENLVHQEKIRKRWPTPWIQELHILFTRASRESLRDTRTFIATIGQTIFILIIIGFGFFRLKNRQSDVLPKIGVLFFIPINASFAVLFPLITPFPLQRALMKRERSAGLYRTSSFFLAKVFLEVPLALTQRLLFYVILYFMVGLRLNAGAFFIFLAINFLQLFNSIALGLMIGSVSPTVDIANVLAPVINVVFLLFGGTFLPSPPPWFVWLKWISPINYTFSALIQNEFVGQSIECDQQTNGACYSTGDQVVASYNAGTFSVAEDVGFMLALSFVFLLMGYLFLRWTAGPRLRFK